jgi:hypothetical protein
VDWLTQPLLSIGQARMSLVALALFVCAVVLVVVFASTVGSLIGSRLLA